MKHSYISLGSSWNSIMKLFSPSSMISGISLVSRIDFLDAEPQIDVAEQHRFGFIATARVQFSVEGNWRWSEVVGACIILFIFGSSQTSQVLLNADFALLIPNHASPRRSFAGQLFSSLLGAGLSIALLTGISMENDKPLFSGEVGEFIWRSLHYVGNEKCFTQVSLLIPNDGLLRASS